MSLADELLADLDDLGNDFEEETEQETGGETATDGDAMTGMEGEAERMDAESTQDAAAPMDMAALVKQEAEETKRRINALVANAKSIHDVAKLLRTKTMTSILQRIDEFTQEQATASHFAGPVENHPEYATIVQTNNLTADVDNEILAVHK
ncbi:hypothetical protein SYNPS1DRAFT_25695, partial [Syncephalis pseudoplumigaleata]